MAYARPLGKMVFNGRPPSAIEEDRKRLEVLGKLIHLEALEKHVKIFFADACVAELRNALAEPHELAEGDKMANLLQEEVKRAGVALSDDENAELVKAEAVHARSEIVRSWVNLLSEARTFIHENQIPLNEHLLPESSIVPSASIKDWQEILEEERQSLEENIALTPPAIQSVKSHFVEALRSSTIERESFLLPHNMSLVADKTRRVSLVTAS